MKRGVVVCVVRRGWWMLQDHCIACQRAYASMNGYEFVLVDTRHHGWLSRMDVLTHFRARGSSLLVLDDSAAPTPTTPPFAETLGKEFVGLAGAASSSSANCAPVIYLRGGRPTQKILDVIASEQKLSRLVKKLVAKRGTQTTSETLQELDARWDHSRPDSRDEAYILRYAGALRKFAELSDAGLEELVTPFRSGGEADEILRAAYLSNPTGAHHPGTLGDAPFMALAAFRRAVRAIAARSPRSLPRLIVDDYRAWQWRYDYLLGILEAPSAEIFRRLAPHARVMIDGGAHIGYYASEVVGPANSQCLLIAIEPHPNNVVALRANLAGMNAVVIEAAIGDRDGVASLYDGTGHSNSSLVGGSHSTGLRFDVDMLKIDTVMKQQQLDSCDLLKLDIEGYEPEAIAGAQSTIIHSKEIVVLVEINPKLCRRRSIEPKVIQDALQSLGLVGRSIRPDFTLGPVGYINMRATMNYLFARPERWKTLTTQLNADKDLGVGLAVPNRCLPVTDLQPVGAD